MTRPVHPLVAELQRRREDRGWTRVELAARSGVSHQTISAGEAGGRNYTSHTLSALAAAFDLEVCLRPRQVSR